MMISPALLGMILIGLHVAGPPETQTAPTGAASVPAEHAPPLAATQPAAPARIRDFRPVFGGHHTEKVGFGPTDLLKSWVIDGMVIDTTEKTALYVVGTDCEIRNTVLNGANHGLRIAYANGMVIDNLKAKCPGRLGVLKITNLGKPGKPCPPTQNITVRNSVFEGYVHVAPQNRKWAGLEKVRDVTFVNVTFVATANSPVLARVTADNVRFTDCTFDVRPARLKTPTAVWAEDFGEARCGQVFISNAKVLSRADQTPHLSGGLRPLFEIRPVPPTDPDSAPADEPLEESPEEEQAVP